jgi:hypothetical protein
VTSYDWVLFRRTAALGLLLGILAVVVMVATDEATNTFAGRLGRLASVAPIVGAGAAYLAMQQAIARGEMRALAAAGAGPARARLGLLVGGAAVGALGPLLAMMPAVDLSTLFPSAASAASRWFWYAGAWFDARRGIAVQSTGELGFADPLAASDFMLGPPPRATTALALSLAALGCPLWSAARASGAHRLLVAVAVTLGAFVVFHLVGAGRAAPTTLAVPPAILLLDAVFLTRSERWF